MSEFLNVALPKGRLGERVYKMFAEAGFPCDELLDPKRKLIFENPEAKVRYFWVKPSDVPCVCGARRRRRGRGRQRHSAGIRPGHL